MDVGRGGGKRGRDLGLDDGGKLGSAEEVGGGGGVSERWVAGRIERLPGNDEGRDISIAVRERRGSAVIAVKSSMFFRPVECACIKGRG